MKTKMLGLLAAGVLTTPLAFSAPVTSPSDLNAARSIMDFESYAIGTPGPISAGGATVSGSAAGAVAVASTLAYAQWPGVVTGNVFGFTSSVSFFINFAQPVAEFGMGVFDPNFPGNWPGYGPVASVNTLRAYDSANTLLGTTVSGTTDFPVGPPGGSWSTFVGFKFAANQIAKIELVGAPGDLLGIDNVSFYRIPAVPEPGSLALLGLGLAGLILSRRRRAI